MYIYVFKVSNPKCTAYTKMKNGSNLPDKINGNEIVWEFVKEMESTDNECLLEDINKNGYCIHPKLMLELGKEKVIPIKNRNVLLAI